MFIYILYLHENWSIRRIELRKTISCFITTVVITYFPSPSADRATTLMPGEDKPALCVPCQEARRLWHLMGLGCLGQD